MDTNGESLARHELTTSSAPRRRSARLMSASSAQIQTVDHLDEIKKQPARKASKRRKVDDTTIKAQNIPPAAEITAAPVTDQPAQFEDTDAKPLHSKRRRRPKPEPVYIIPDVEKKETSFRGRLGESNYLLDLLLVFVSDLSVHGGYACLNTILRNKKPADESVFCSRTCRYVTSTLVSPPSEIFFIAWTP